MAEEQIYDEQVVTDGDPKDPLGLRKKMKAKPDPLGLRGKASTPPKEFKVVIEQPSSKPKPVTAAREMSMQRDLSKPETTVFNIGGQLKQVDLGVERARSKALEAQKKITKELLENDDVIESTIRKERYDAANQQRLAQQEGQIQSDMPSVQSAAMQVDPRIPTPIRPQDEIVTPQDILNEKLKMSDDPLRARNILERVAQQKPEKAKEIQKAIYQLDVANSLEDDEKSGRRINQIEKNVEDIGKGDVIYDMRSGRLIKPENFMQSVVTGWKNKTKLFEDYDKFKNTENNAAIAMDLNDRMVSTPDVPIPVPEGKLAELGSMIGGTPAKALVGGAIGGLAGPEGAMVAGGLIGGREMAKLEYANTFQQIYYELRNNGVDEYEAVEQARKQANEAAEIGFATGAAMGIVGGRIGMRPLPKAVLNEGFRKAVISSAKSLGGALSKATKEGLALGGVAAGGQIYKNALAQDAGINREIDEGTVEHVESMLLFSLGVAAATKGAKAFSPKAYRTLMSGLSRAKPEQVELQLQQMVDNGQITPEQATKTIQDITDYKAKDAAIPETVAPEARVEIQDLIERRGNLEKRLETEDKAFHPELKEKIKVIDEQIVEKSKTKADKAPKEETDLKRFVDDQIEEGNIQGFTKDVLASALPEELPAFFKEIADQAHDSNSANMTLETYGEAVVNKAKQMYPAKPRVTVSTPGIRNVRAKEGALPEYNVTFEQGIGSGDITQGKDLIAAGSESTVYRDGDTVIKISEPYNDPSTFNARVEDAKIINDALGDGSLEVIGVHKSPNGTPNPIFRQKFVEGEKATPEQIDAFMESKGFEKKGAGYENDQYRFTDIDADNAIVDANGQVHIIDAGVEKLKPKSDAVPIGKSETPIVGETPINRGEMGEGIPKPEEFAREEGPQGKDSGKEEIGITHAAMDEVAKEFGFDTYEKDPETVAGWDFEAARRLREDPNALPELFQKLRSGEEKIDHIDNRMMIQYMADLKAKINKNPTNELLNQLKRAKDLFNVEGRAWGKAGRARQGTKPVEETLGDFLIQDLDDNRGVPLTEEQKAKTKEQFDKIQRAGKKYKESVDRIREEKAKKSAESEIGKIKKESKKDTNKDYKKEREEIIAQMRADLLKVAKGGGGLMSTIPGAAQLKAIAPHVAKLVKNLVEQGVHELPAVIKAVHDQLKDIIPSIREKDVHDLIAGEYREPRKKRSQVAERLYDLQTEAQLITQLENLERGIPPKSPKERQKRNAKIEELRQKIKEHDVKKLADYKRRINKDIEKLKEELKKGDFEKEKPEPLELDKEAREAKDELLKLREEREVSRMKKLYEDKNWLQKALDFGGKVLRTPKTIKASFDVSFLGRQTNVGTIKQLMELPFKKNKDGKWEFTNFEAQKKLRKQVADMYRSFGSETAYRRVMADILEDPLYQTMPDKIRSKIGLSDPDSPLSRFREEEHQTSLIDYIPQNTPIVGFLPKGVKASNRAASAISNQMKWDIFKQFAEGFMQDGRTYKNSPEIYEAAAKYANQLVGRGFLGQKIEKANAVTSPIFWSLRLQASRLQLMTNFLNPMFYKNAPKEVRVAYLRDMTKFVLTGMTILGLANAAGAEVELDPRSSDFGSIKVGETRYDIWGGFKQYAVLFSRMASGQTKAGGQIKDLKDTFADDLDSRQKSRGSVLGKFVQSKLTPEAGLGLNLLMGEDYMGKPLEGEKIAWDLVTPLLYKDFTEAYKDGGVAKAILTLMASIHGIGANTYSKEDSKPSSPKRGGGRKPATRNQRRNPRTQNR